MRDEQVWHECCSNVMREKYVDRDSITLSNSKKRLNIYPKAVTLTFSASQVLFPGAHLLRR